MSTVSLPPDYYERPEPPPRRRRSWKRIAAWIAGGLIAFAALLVIGSIALLHNSNFRLYLLNIAHTKLSEAVGIELKMRDFSVGWSGLSPAVDMYDVVIDGAPPYTTPPLVTIDHLKVGVQVVSLLGRKWYLKDIVIDHPVARVFVGQDGSTNLPELKSSDQKTDVFDLGIRHVMLGQGELFYNDRKSSLDADLHNFEFQSSFDTDVKRYSGGLSYKDGKIHFQNLNPMVHSLEAEFEATPDTFNLKRSRLSSGASEFSLVATLNDYVHPKVTATYQSSLDTGELRQILKDATLPVGVVKLVGSAKYESDANKPLLETLTMDGNVSSKGLQIHTPSIHTLVRDISGNYVVQHGNVDVRDLRAALLGGTMNGNLKMRDITGAQVSELHATLRNVALASLQALASPQAMKDYRLAGTANAKVDANWRKTFDTLTARTDADFKGTIQKRNAGPAGTTPSAPSAQPPLLTEEGNVHAAYSAASNTVSFTQSYIQAGQTRIDLDGTISKTASLQVRVRSNDLAEVETVASAFGAMPQPLGLGGMATFDGTIRGSASDPLIMGQIAATSLKVKDTEWRTVRADLDAGPSKVTLRNAEITPGTGRGRVAANVSLELDRWTFRDSSPFQLDVNATQLSVADLKRLAGIDQPVTGTLTANVSLHGSQVNPIGKGTITLTQATIANEPVQSASIEFQGTGDEVKAQLGLRIPAGSAQSTVTYFPKRKAYDGEVRATGIRLDQLAALRERNLDITGTLNLTAKGSGTFDDPGLELTAQIPQLQLQNQKIDGITLQATIANRVATATLDSQSQALNAVVRGRGRVNLSGDYAADALFDTTVIPLQPLVALYLPAQSANLSGQTEIHATLKGPLKDYTRLDAHLTVPMLSLAYTDKIKIAAAQPIQLDYTRGVLTLQKTAIRGTGTDLQLQGTVPVTGDAPISLVALGTIDLGIAQMFDPDITSSGQIQFNVDGMGHRSDPNVQGQIKIVNAAFAGDSLPLGLQNGNGVLTLTNNRLEVGKFQGDISGGTLTATGAITLRPSIQFNLSAVANGIRTLYPQGVREGIDTNLTLVGSPENATLRGQVRLTELSFSPTFDLNDLAGIAGATAGSAAPPGSFARNLHLNITVISTDDINLASSKLSLQGAANLRINGTAAEPSLLGRVNVTSGDLFYRGNRYFLDASTLDFIDPYKIDPRVNLRVSTKVQDYNINMQFRGTLDRLRTTYSSEPALPPADIINLLVFGKTKTASDNSTFGKADAEAAIASSVSNSLINSPIEKIAGISQFSIDPVLGGNQQDPGARITIQQRVTGSLFVTFATDATSTQRQVIKLDYQATPRVGISGVRDQNGGFAVDVKVKKSW